MVKRLALGVKFPVCLASPGSDYREEWLPSCIFLGSYISQRQGTAVVTLRQCLKTPPLPILAGAGYQLSLMIVECLSGLSVKSN